MVGEVEGWLMRAMSGLQDIFEKTCEPMSVSLFRQICCEQL